jgi:hypothetical protein
MPDKSGQISGLTIFSPVKIAPHLCVWHEEQLRGVLKALARDEHSPFAQMRNTHLCRLQLLEDVVFMNNPAKYEQLASSYLIFEANVDGEARPYFESMAREAPAEVEAIWSHCVGYPGVKVPRAFADYMRRCQLTTTFYFADVNDKTVGQAMRALKVKVMLGDFVAENQLKRGIELKAAFQEFVSAVRAAPDPLPGKADPPPGYHRN